MGGGRKLLEVINKFMTYVDCGDGFKGVYKKGHNTMRFQATYFKVECSGIPTTKIQLTQKTESHFCLFLSLGL